MGLVFPFRGPIVAARVLQLEWFQRPRRLWIGDVYAAMGLSAWGVAWSFPYLPFLQAVWPTCHFLQITGWPCGTCGLTRAFTSGARLDVATAFVMSPLGTIGFYLGGLASLWIAGTWLWRQLPLPRLQVRSRAVWLSPFVLFLANWAYLIWKEAVG